MRWVSSAGVLVFEKYSHGQRSLQLHSERAAHATLLETMGARVSPDDRCSLQECLRDASEKVGAFTTDYRIALPDGREAFVAHVVAIDVQHLEVRQRAARQRLG